MKLIIDIPKEVIESAKSSPNYYPAYHFEKIWRAIANGIPLPKGHGDLVDRDKINGRFYSIWKELESYSNQPSWKKLLDKWSMCMDDAPTIIEADKESEVNNGK